MTKANTVVAVPSGNIAELIKSAAAILQTIEKQATKTGISRDEAHALHQLGSEVVEFAVVALNQIEAAKGGNSQ